MYKAKVGFVTGEDRRRNVYRALDAVREQVTIRLADPVMLKPNFLSSDNQLASSHPDAIRGVIDFLLSTDRRPAEILVAEGGNEQKSGATFRNFGYHALPDEYDIPIRLVDLNQESDWVPTPIILADGSEYAVHMPRTVLDCPCTISVAIPKTHDTCVVTLALKNIIMGTIRKVDRVRMHGFHSHAERRLPDESKAMNINLIRLARFLAPDISVIDGVQCLQGNGPGGTDEVRLDMALAGVDVFAVDAMATQLMGFEPLAMGLLHYGHELGLGIADPHQIHVIGPPIAEATRAFKPHEQTELQMQWQHPAAVAYLQAASS